MSNPKHTPGPWNIASTGNHQGLVIAENGENIAVVYDKKNTAVLSAAPELLEALETAEDQITRDGECVVEDHADKSYRLTTLKAVHTALAKAKGDI